MAGALPQHEAFPFVDGELLHRVLELMLAAQLFGDHEFVDILVGLVKHKCLTKKEVEALPHTVTVAVRDLRTDTRTPLPDFSAPAKKAAPR
ncbi:MAG: hypothetical protein ACI89X_000301 [Planctomycetota bacterium]|jgi:hypothetical protein